MDAKTYDWKQTLQSASASITQRDGYRDVFVDGGSDYTHLRCIVKGVEYAKDISHGSGTDTAIARAAHRFIKAMHGGAKR